MEADLEVHLIPEGYVGLCRLGDGMVNVCGLFRRNEPAPDVAERWREYLRGPEGSSLRRRMEGAKFEEESFRAVAGLDLAARGWGGVTNISGGEWSVGDSLTMIAPVAGNGMSMALESAAISAEELSAYSRGEAGWKEARERAARRCAAAFGARLRWARWLHEGLLSGRAADLVLRVAGWCPGGWRFLFGRTR
jgi:flavin-dependent dehydrogenase